MRVVNGIKYEIVKESDVCESLIYAFDDHIRGAIVFLCRKNNQFFWKPVNSVCNVWYEMYDSIEEAIEKINEVKEFKKLTYHRQFSGIIEFESQQKFFEWSLIRIKTTFV